METNRLEITVDGRQQLGERLESEVLSDTMMEQHFINTEEKEHQQEEYKEKKGNQIDKMNEKIIQDIDRLSPLPKNPCIFRVHESLRESNHKAYTPELVSIGPYHHGGLKFVAMEVHKKRYLNSILKRKNQVSVKTYLEAMMELEDRARDCYANPIDLNGNEFVEMMLLDGCFVIEFLCNVHLSIEIEVDDPIFQESWMRLIVQHDLMLLLENQLPFFVLSKLYDMINDTPNIPFSLFMELAIKFILSKTILFSEYSSSSFDISSSSSESKHFLDMVHKVCVPSTGYEIPMTMSSREVCRKILCVTELQEAGVKVRPKVKEGHDHYFSLFDISFEGDQMNIPKIDVGAPTEKIFRNMIAYEQHSSYTEPKYFSHYTYFMHLLINSGEDVNQLCRNNIFEYKVGNDDQVALMFNKLGEGRVFYRRSFYLSKLCKNVNAHCDQTWNKLKVKLKRDYFYSPWAGVSTVAAAFLIFLTVIQTMAALITLLT